MSAEPAERFDSSTAERHLLDQAQGIARTHAHDGGEAPAVEQLRAAFRALAPTGYLGSLLPRSAGGKGLSALEFAALVEGLSPELPLLGNHSVQRYLHDFGTPEQCRRFLPGLLGGDEIGAIAITEPQAGSDLSRIETVARRTHDRYVLSGSKTWVTHGMVASCFIVLARTGDEARAFTRFIVPAETAGLRRTPLNAAGLRHLTFARVDLTDCEIPVELRLGEEGSGAGGAKAAFPIARALAALQSLRIAQAALEIAAAYARERVTASRALAERSLVQHRYATLWASCEATRLLSLRALADLGAPKAATTAAAAKAMAGDLALDACRWAFDCTGASGLAADHRLARLHADARMMSVVDGTSVLNSLVVARRTIARLPEARTHR